MINKRFADFFAGIGLAEIGLRGAGWRCVFANDIDPKKHEMFKGQFKGRFYRRRDVHELAAEAIPEAALWWASFPCTDVSLAGYRKGLAGSQTGALLGVLRLLREKDGQRPSLVVLENVVGFINSHGGSDFEETIRELNGIGYTCDAFIVDAVHFLPQSRPRLFIVGVFDYPSTAEIREALSERHSALKTRQLEEFMLRNPDLRWTVLDIPQPPTRKTQLSDMVERLHPSSPYWWSQERVDYLLGQMSARHRAVAENLRNRRKIHYATVYRRMRNGKSMAELRADGVAGCLRTPRGGSSRQILLVAGNGNIRVRFMTPREYARLMGAPNYKITVTDNQAYFGFGDAVCVPVVKWIGRTILEALLSEFQEKPTSGDGMSFTPEEAVHESA